MQIIFLHSVSFSPKDAEIDYQSQIVEKLKDEMLKQEEVMKKKKFTDFNWCNEMSVAYFGRNTPRMKNY